MKKIAFLLVVFLLIAAYLAGFWPQHQQLQAAQQKVTDLTGKLDQAQSVIRLARLENELLVTLDQTQSQNYGEAQKLSNTFFEDLRHELDRAESASYRQQLETILQRRDNVTAGLARADAATAGMLKQSLDEMRQLFTQLASASGA